MTSPKSSRWRVLSKDSLLRFEMLVGIAKWVFPRYRFKWPQLDWWDDTEFNRFLAKFDESRGMNSDRRWMLLQLMQLVHSIPGDTAECGVYQGASSYLICAHNEQNDTYERTHYIFDSFEGLSESVSAEDGDHWSAGDLACTESDVARNLHQFSNVSLHKGWIPTRFGDVQQRQFAFVHIDVDLYQPTRDSIEFFYPRMNQGGIILCDDYGFSTCPGATRSVDEYLADKPEKFLALPDGGYPFEAAKPEDIFQFYQQRGFEMSNFTTVNGHGCNQFLFRNTDKTVSL